VRCHTGGGLCSLDLLELGMRPGLLEAAAGGPAGARAALEPAARRFAARAVEEASGLAGPCAAGLLTAPKPGMAQAAGAGTTGAAGPAERLQAVRMLLAGAIGLQNDVMSVDKDASDGELNAAVFVHTKLAAESAAAAPAAATSAGVSAAAAAAGMSAAAIEAVIASADRLVDVSAALAAHGHDGAAPMPAAAVALLEYQASGARLARAIVSVMLGAARRRYGDASVGRAVPDRWRI
jgi:hypothetical protein